MKKFLLLFFVVFLLMMELLPAQTLGWRRLLDEPTFEVWVNPENYNTVVAGGHGRRFWKSNDAGITWKMIPLGGFTGGNSQLNNLIIHPLDTNVLIIGGLIFGDVRRSTDAGETWSICLQAEYSVQLNGKALVWKPDEPDVLYIGDDAASVIYKSTDRGATWDSISTVQYHTKMLNNEGIEVDTTLFVRVASIAIREDSTNILLAGTMSGEVFVSTDHGVTWQFTDVMHISRPAFDRSDNEITRMEFNNKDPLIGYAVITYLNHGNTPNGGLWKTTDGGYNWDLLAFGDTSMWAVASRKLDNGNHEIFMGGYTEYYHSPDTSQVPGIGMVRRSQDNGLTWWSFDPFIEWHDPNETYQSLCVVNDTTVHIVGDRGLRIKTTNRTLNVDERYKTSDSTFYGISFANENLGFKVGQDGAIFKTANAGINFSKVESPTLSTLYAINFFNDASTGLAVGEFGTIIRTVDEGTNWTVNQSPTNQRLNRVAVANDFALAIGNNGTALRSNDKGFNWELLNTGFDQHLNSAFAYNENTFFVTGNRGLLLKTTDKGDTWTNIETGTNNNLYGIFFAPNNTTAIIAADSGFVVKTYDAGNTWITQRTGSKMKLLDVAFVDNDTCIVIGFSKTIMRTTNSGETWNIARSAYGPRANMWSLRYFGPKGVEKLYMATEAGLFVLDFPSYVEELRTKDPNSNLNIFVSQDKHLTFAYERIDLSKNEPLQLRVIDMQGKTIFTKNYNLFYNDNLFDSIYLPQLSRGIYLCQIIEANNISTQLFSF